MSETLVIRLPAAAGAQASWIVVDANGARSGPVQTGPLPDALGAAQGRRVVLLLPGSDVTLSEPELPVRGGARLAQAVPFALEEHLASDVEGLHFAIGSRAAGAAGTPVAVVAHSAMERWLDASAEAGIHPDCAYADSAAVPLVANGCVLLLDGDVLYVHRAGTVPLALEADPLADALAIALDGSTDATGHVTFYASPADYAAQRETIEGLRSRASTLHVKLMPDGPMPLLAAQCVQAPGIDLLQGRYAPRSSLRAGWPRWRLAAGLAALAALAYLLNNGVSVWQLSRTEKALDAQISALLAQALPGSKAEDPRAEMDRILGGGGQPGVLLPVLAGLAKAMASTPQARLESVTAQGETVDLRLEAPSVQALDAIVQAMSAGGLSAQIQATTPRGSVVEGRMQVRVGRS